MELTTVASDNGSYSFGSITDGIWKLRVRIVLYIANEKFVQGVHLRLNGVMHNDPSEFFFQ